MPYWVQNVNGSGVVVGPFNSAPTGMNLTTLIGYPTKAAAQSAASALAPIGNPANIPGDIGKTVTNDALKPLFDSHIWLRVAEVVVGLILIGIGLNSMLKGKPLSIVTGAAGVVSKVVPA
jgi:hypothetical protein